jgi:hypothetical protein
MKEKSKGVALILSSFPIFGIFGFDKLYVGHYKLFFIQFICSILVIGTIFTLPYTILCSIILIISIFFGTKMFLYPSVNWKPTNFDDKIIAGGIVIIYIYIIVCIFLLWVFSDNVNMYESLSFVL